MQMSTKEPLIALPGQFLGSAKAGTGTYQSGSNVPSALVGHAVVDDENIRVEGRHKSQAAGTSNVLPEVNDIILGRVVRITPRQAVVNILVVGSAPLKDEFQGVVRVQDVRMFEKDKVKIHTSFRPDDIVRAEIISLGDQNNYYLSTAKNELGVVFATSETGELMVPISWREMQYDGGIEERKVAKPV